jgi:hypothetical protein
MSEDEEPNVPPELWDDASMDVEDSQVVNYHFPVQIEVRTEAAPMDLDNIVELTLRRLTRGLEGA